MASLGKDLATIRKKQNLSFEDIYEATKIPKHIISTIEDNSIFTEFDENTTYIRSYVRSYAKALSIDDQQIVYALDKQESGNYSGSLQKMGGSKSDEPFDFEDETEDETEAETKQDPTDEMDEVLQDHSPDPEPETSPQPPASPKSKSYSERVRSVDWVDMGHQIQPLEKKSKIWIGVLIILILGTGGLYFFLSSSNSYNGVENTSANQSQPAGQSDSLQLNIIPPAESDSTLVSSITQNNQPYVAREALPDTLNIVVYAAYGKLEPVRIFTDIMDNFNPYWIEKGRAMRFSFVNNFRLRGQFNNLVLLMNGHVIENYLEKFYDPDTRLIEINRSFFEGNEKWLQPAPDSLKIGAPPPFAIQERPTYN